VGKAVEEKIKNCSQKAVAIDAVNLIESGLGRLCQATVAVTADRETRIGRVMARDGLTRDQAARRVDAQKSEQAYRDSCDHALDNRWDSEADFARAAGAFFDALLGDLPGNNMEEWTDNGTERMEGKGF
jgi:dephospho-CoA kinase